MKNKKGGIFGLMFTILGLLVFIIAFTLIIFVVYFLFAYGFPTLNEAIKYVASKGG